MVEGFWTARRVLVTGGAGFIGSHLVERLVELEAQVSVLDNLQAGHWSNLARVQGRFAPLEGDIRQATEVRRWVARSRSEVVFHLAANASVPGSVKEPLYDFETNCGGTVNLLEALRLAGGCQKFILASSGAVYGQPSVFPIREEAALQPISPYGASKQAAEIETHLYGMVYGLPVLTARLFNAYGPRMARFVILDFLRKLHNNSANLEILGNGQQIRDFTYVSDTVSGLLLLAERGTNGEAYNLSSGVTHSIKELAELLLAQLGLSGRTTLAYTGQSWVGDAQRWEVDLTKIDALGYRAAVGLEEGLAEVIEWFRRTYTGDF